MKDKKLAKTFGERLYARRIKAKATQVDYAKKLKIPATMLCHLEAGRFTPSATNLVKYSKALKVSSDYLLGLRAR